MDGNIKKSLLKRHNSLDVRADGCGPKFHYSNPAKIQWELEMYDSQIKSNNLWAFAPLSVQYTLWQ